MIFTQNNPQHQTLEEMQSKEIPTDYSQQWINIQN
jgi:hypothetical protein